MLSSTILPECTFLDDRGDATVVALSEQSARIRGLADLLATRVDTGSVVGLIYRTGPDLVLNWLACVLAGLEPLIIQYPTRKQSREYWLASVRSTLEIADVRAVIADAECADMGLAEIVPVISQRDLDGAPVGASEPFTVDSFAIIQLSSGTTGHRKAIRFTGEQLVRHSEDYNRVLKMDGSDRIVSWLPLYHDMGYIACFVMPMLLGVPVTMMDPMTWVAAPERLFDAIAQGGGSICYMPNFGFEVMARQPARALPTMRHWVSCSEPVAPATARKFVEHVGATSDRFAACYAMAENVFAVCFKAGLDTRTRDDVEVASCGAPIPGVDLRIADDDELWVRSPASLTAYIGGAAITDADGYYPTGDLGFIDDDQVFITGRKQDLLIQAGRKFMLSDIDLALNRLLPEVRGRGVAVQVYDERLGTQKPVVLIEAADFITRTDRAELEQGLKDELGLDQAEVAFVPPRFLTKTSSGKFNRKISAQHWLDARAFQNDRTATATNPIAELRQNFGAMNWAKPVGEVLDSLSLTVLRIIISDAGVRYDAALSLAGYAALLEAGKTPGEDGDTSVPVFRIVSIADRRTLDAVDEAWIEEASRRLGAPVHYEHICLPPSPVLLSDLVFHDWFQCRLDQAPFAIISQTFEKLRRASVILLDDKADMFIASRQVYGVLSHGLRRDPRADQVTVRWQRYPQFHDEVPLTVVAGRDTRLTDRAPIHAMLQKALGTPLFRLAMNARFDEITADWEFHPARRAKSLKVEGLELLDALVGWSHTTGDAIKRLPGMPENRFDAIDLAHYCSSFANRESVEELLDHYDRFVIVGQRSSAPFVRKEIERRGKSYVYAHSYAPEVLESLPDPYDCVLMCGSMGTFRVDGPAVAVMANGLGWQTQNIEDTGLQDKRYKNDKSSVETGTDDWFYPAELGREAANPEDRRVSRERSKDRRAKKLVRRKAKIARGGGTVTNPAREARIKRLTDG